MLRIVGVVEAVGADVTAVGRRPERDEIARTLGATSPLAVLGRGYSLTRKKGSTEPELSSSALAPGDEIESVLAHGSVLSQVLETLEPMDNA